jgi:hypothetical protein
MVGMKRRTVVHCGVALIPNPSILKTVTPKQLVPT